MVIISNSLKKHHSHYHTYPSSLKDFVSQSPINSHWKKDCWGNEYFYKVQGDNKYVLKSSGKDEKFETNDDIMLGEND